MCQGRPAGTLSSMNTHPAFSALNPTARVAAIAAAAGLALLAAACGSGSASTASADAAASGPSGSAFTQCMRTHGVPDYPAPQSNGQLPKIASGQQVGVSDSALRSAQTACQSLWPYQALTPAQRRQQLSEYVTFARCMRASGYPDFPDPVSSGGQVMFTISVSRDGFDPHSPQVLAKARACMRVLPAGSQLPSVSVTP